MLTSTRLPALKQALDPIDPPFPVDPTEKISEINEFVKITVV